MGVWRPAFNPFSSYAMQSHFPGQSLASRKLATRRLSVIATACVVLSNPAFAERIIAEDQVTLRIDDGRSIDSGAAIGPEGYAVWAKPGGTIYIEGGSDITTHGSGADAVTAQGSGSVTLRGGSVTAENGMGLYVWDGGSVDASNVDITSGPARIAVRSQGGGTIRMDGGSITARDANGVMAFDKGAVVELAGVDIAVVGTRSYGAEANVDAAVRMKQGSVSTSGSHSYGLYTIGAGSSISAEGTRVRTSGNGAHGAFSLTGDITLSDVDIATSGASAWGIGIDGLNDPDGTTSVGRVTGGAVRTSGESALGLAAFSNGQIRSTDLLVETNGANARGAMVLYGGAIGMRGGSVSTSGDGAHGFYLYGAKAGTNQLATVAAEGTAITTRGAAAHGALLRNDSQLIMVGSDMTTHGANAMALRAVDVTPGTAKVSLTDSRLTSTQAAGIQVEGVTLDATLVRSTVSGTTNAIEVFSHEDGGAGALNLALESSTLTGGTRLEAGNTLNLSVDRASTWNVAGDATVTRVWNTGTIDLAQAGTPAGKTLRVTNDYTGNGGTLVLSTQMGGDASATDKLVLDGARATGDTALRIRHAGGEGAQTVNGIRVVETRNGGSTESTAFRLDPLSDGYRTNTGSIAAGAYDYHLSQGGNGGQAEDWYLVSSLRAAGNVIPPLRPEVGAYLNNKLAASTMLFHTLRDRQGTAAGLAPAQDAAASDRGHGWIRMAGSATARDGAQGLHSSDTRYLVHAGSDVFRWSVGDGSLRVGAMGTYGGSRNASNNGQLSAHGKVDGYGAGIYGTWYGNRSTDTGPYVDTWVMYGAYDNEVSGEGLPTESYRSSNLVASVEAGHAFQIHESANAKMYLEPQLQIIYSSYHADTHVEQGGTVVSRLSENSVTTRLGVRLHGDVKHPETAASAWGAQRMRPFAEINWWHGPASQAAQFDALVVSEALPENRFEAKVGLQGDITRRLAVWGSVGVETGANDFTQGKAQVGMRYRW